MPNILVATLGTWQLVPEIIGFTNPGLVDLYKNHPEARGIADERTKGDIAPVDQVRLLTTGGEFAEKNLSFLYEWYAFLDPEKKPQLNVWKVTGTENLSTAGECRLMTEAIFRMVWNACNTLDGGKLLLSLAGGRKTMSSDLQRAAAVFGCHALLHVTQNEAITDFTRNWQTPSRFTEPLPERFLDAITPIVVGGYPRNPVLDIEGGGIRLQHRDDFSLPAAAHGIPAAVDPCLWKTYLVDAVNQILEKSSFLYCHYTGRMVEGEKIANFMALYSLSTEIIQQLKQIRFGVDLNRRDHEIAFLKKLPKTDLHCHLGGVADAVEIIEIAAANRDLIEKYRDRLTPWLDHWKKRLDFESPKALHHEISFKQMRTSVTGVPEPICIAAFVLLFEDLPELLEEIIYGPFIDDKAFLGIDFDAYEKLGDIQGSGLLQSPESIQAACEIICRKARRHNVKYLELRCSPANYTRGGIASEGVIAIIENVLLMQQDIRCGMIFIASRHGRMGRIYEHIELAENLVASRGDGFPLLKGFDLAGSEKAAPARDMRIAFLPMMEKCMHLTIHAGEKAPVDSIWEAVYHLSAERIGHGLTLKDNPVLMERFRDRGIALEMCPSSNTQIVGFRDNFGEGKGFGVYPLKEYLDAGLRVTVNTDNPGISRTDASRELYRAAALTPGGLSLWDILLLIRNGFKTAFTGRSERQELLRSAEKEIIGILERDMAELGDGL